MLKSVFSTIAVFTASVSMAHASCEGTGELTIVSATDDGLYEETHGPENSIDGNLDPESRWSNQSQGAPKSLLLDLGALQTLKSFGVVWYKGDERKATFAIEASTDGTEFQPIVDTRQTEGQSLDLENYEVTPLQAQYVRVVANGNEANDWNSIVEVKAFGCGEAVEKPAQPILTERKGKGMFGLRVDQTPDQNFDLKGWYITTPADDNGDGKADSVYENDLAAGWTDERYFYTDPATGGMVFRTTPAGAKTSKNTKYTRTELRGMLRRGDDSIPTRLTDSGSNANNWVFSSAPASAKANAGGIDGTLRATLAVNQVTRLGKGYQVGRVIIGQIHARNDEPIRLYYRKLPHNKYGSIFYAHEPAIGKEQWVNILGSRADRITNPDDGIALDEVFSYEIKVTGEIDGAEIVPTLHVKITRDDGTEVSAEPFDMRKSGFSTESEFMFFKAGAYTGNNSSPTPETDFDKVTFFKLETEHDPVPAWMSLHAKKTKKIIPPVTDKTPPHPAKVGVVFDDSFSDGERDNGADPMDGNWWTTSAKSAIEIEPGRLGLVSGTSGRGIRTTFTPQTLADGQTLKASFTFTTPTTIGADRLSALRVGLHDKLERVELEEDQQASSGIPNEIYNGLPGYMVDFDVNPLDAAAANVEIRKHRNDIIGRLMGTYKAYDPLAAGGETYRFEPNQTYQGVVSVSKRKDGLEITASLANDGGEVTRFNHFDAASDVNNFGMLSFHVNSKTFGSTNAKGNEDNGITFNNVRLEILQE